MSAKFPEGFLEAVQDACERGIVHEVRALLDGAGASVKNLTVAGVYPGYSGSLLHIACAHGHVNLVRELLNRGADIEAMDRFGETPLQFIIRLGKTDVIRELLEHGANLEAGSNEGHAPLCLAITSGHLSMIPLLLSKGASTNAVGPNGSSVLHRASGLGYVDIVNVLLDNGADVDIEDGNGRTPLIVAVCCDCRKVIETLLTRGAGVDVPDAAGCVALHHARDVSVVELLLDAGADIDYRNKAGLTALDLLFKDISLKRSFAAKLLLSRGASCPEMESLIPKVKKHFDSRCSGMRDLIEFMEKSVAEAAEKPKPHVLK